MQSALCEGFGAVCGRGLAPCETQRAHGMALHVVELRGDFVVAAVGQAHRAHDFGCTFDAKYPSTGKTAFNKGCHVFAFGRKGQPVDNPCTVAERFVVCPVVKQPHQQSTFCRIAERRPRSIEKGGRIGGHGFGELGIRKGIVTNELLYGHPVAGQRTCFVGTDDCHGAHRFAGVHFAHEIVRSQHLAHGDGQRKGDAHGKSLGHSHDDQCHRDHEDVEQMLGDVQPPMARRLAREEKFGRHDAEDDYGDGDADTPDQP